MWSTGLCIMGGARRGVVSCTWEYGSSRDPFSWFMRTGRCGWTKIPRFSAETNCDVGRTVVSSQVTWWYSDQQCSARALDAVLPVTTDCWCSLIQRSSVVCSESLSNTRLSIILKGNPVHIQFHYSTTQVRGSLGWEGCGSEIQQVWRRLKCQGPSAKFPRLIQRALAYVGKNSNSSQFRLIAWLKVSHNGLMRWG